jgi:hypothetical protein
VDVDCAADGACADCDDASGRCTRAASDNRVCRPPSGDCDVEERCDGAELTCPVDVFLDDTHVCRPPLDLVCDPAETCTGIAALCPTNQTAPSSVVCLAAENDCDYDDHCGGGLCLPSGKVPLDTPCNGNGVSSCSGADSCDGLGACREFDELDTTVCDGCLAEPCWCQAGVCVEAGPPTLSVSAGCVTTTCTACTLTIDLDGRTGAAGQINCWAPRQLLPADGPSDADRIATFDASDDGWTLSNVGRFEWLFNWPSSCGPDNAGDYFMEFQADSTSSLTLATPVNATGYRDLEISFWSGYYGVPDAGEHLTPYFCCGPGCTPNQVIDSPIPNSNEGGVVACSSYSRGNIDSTPPAGANGCSSLRLRLEMVAAGSNDEYGAVDNISLSGVPIIDAPAELSGGTYRTTVESCVTQQFVVTCDWSDGVDTSSGTVSLTFP